MTQEVFEKVLTERIANCVKTLNAKADEYATSDRLHNFKLAGEVQGCTPIKALGGMMCKHTVSVYDLINDFEQGKDIPIEMWNEKIGDSINYLLLLDALIREDMTRKPHELFHVIKKNKPALDFWNSIFNLELVGENEIDYLYRIVGCK